MSVRSSMQFPSLVALGACALLGGCASARGGPATAQLSAKDLPELGDSMPDKTEVAAAGPQLVMAKLDLNTPVSRLCANPRAKAVLDSDLPGLTTRPEFAFFKSMSLNTLKKMSRGQMSDADLAKVQAELARLDEPPRVGDQ